MAYTPLPLSSCTAVAKENAPKLNCLDCAVCLSPRQCHTVYWYLGKDHQSLCVAHYIGKGMTSQNIHLFNKQAHTPTQISIISDFGGSVTTSVEVTLVWFVLTKFSPL